MDEVKKQLWDKLQDDISELNEGLQHLLEVWVNKWTIEEGRNHLRNRWYGLKY